jgi:hypothetical protein
MRPMLPAFVLAASLVALLPSAATAQCEGGTFAGGYYLQNGTYVPGHCAYTNSVTPGQLFPSGAQPVPSTNPAAASSRLPGQLVPSGPLSVNTTDIGPAPSFLTGELSLTGGQPATGTTAGPGVSAATLPLSSGGLQPAANANLGAANTTPDRLNTLGVASGVLPLTGAGAATTGSLLPGQFPPTGVPALTGNRGLPRTTVWPGMASSLGTGDPAGVYGTSLPAAPVPAEEPDPGEPPAPGRGGSTIIGH